VTRDVAYPLLVTFLPLLGALLLPLVPTRHGTQHAWALARLVATASFVFSIPIFLGYSPAETTNAQGVAFEVDAPWFTVALFANQALTARFHLGVDGLSLLLVLLTTFVSMLTLFSARSHVRHREKEFLFWALLMETGMVGVFLALDFFLFYVFWELMLVPLYFIIGIWGGERRLYASIKFFLYTLAGSLLMLVAIIWMVSHPIQLPGQLGPTVTTSILDHAMNRTAPFPESAQWLLFAAFAIAFAVKVPVFPFHTWLPDAHVEAPTAGSVVLAGVLLKMGTYGLVRFCLPMFPAATVQAAPFLMALGVVGILYGAFLAWSQGDLKKLVAYSSISHLGYVVLGTFALNPEGLAGGLLQMVNHGLATPALFLLVGMVYERAHTRHIADFGGIARTMPLFAFFLVMATFASVGLPGFNGFVGEFLCLLGGFKSSKTLGTLAALGVLFGAVYMLSMVRRVLFGPLPEGRERLPDLRRGECAVLAPLVVLFLWIGCYPEALLSKVRPTLDRIQRVAMEGQR
jgi:NADH-quinone oxidoreductase subunit M